MNSSQLGPDAYANNKEKQLQLDIIPILDEEAVVLKASTGVNLRLYCKLALLKA